MRTTLPIFRLVINLQAMPTIISQNIKRLQKLKELTIHQLAEKSGVSERTIERIRSGRHVPDLHTISLLAKALGQKPEHLVEGAIRKIANWNGLEVFESNDPNPKHWKLTNARKDFTKAEAKEILAKSPKGDYTDLKEMWGEPGEYGATQTFLQANAVLDAAERQMHKDFAKFKREMAAHNRIQLKYVIEGAVGTAVIMASLYILLQLLPPWQ